MRARRILWLSMALNIALAAATAYLIRSRPLKGSASDRAAASNSDKLLIKTNLVVRRQYFTWHEVESTDFRTYIRNLRVISCPEATIRDIIVAEVNALYERKQAEIVIPEQAWWRSEPSQGSAQAAVAQFDALDAERRALLSELLGSAWETTNVSGLAVINFRLDGPVLSNLAPRAKQAIKEIEERTARRREQHALNRQRAGKESDPSELERIEQQLRNEMAQFLSSEELEEYLLRYSQTARSLRTELREFNLTRDEFRAVFRARDPIEQQIRLFSNNDDPVNIARRFELERQREVAAKQALGPDRYQLFKFAQDPLFQQAQSSAQQIGAPPEAVIALYQINQATELEKQRIRSDQSLSLEQRATALAQMLAHKEESVRRILGDAVYERYRQQQQ